MSELGQFFIVCAVLSAAVSLFRIANLLHDIRMLLKQLIFPTPAPSSDGKEGAR
jgi:hypothetical protein